jgi:hypothetical protein
MSAAHREHREHHDHHDHHDATDPTGPDEQIEQVEQRDLADDIAFGLGTAAPSVTTVPSAVARTASVPGPAWSSV